MVREQTGGMTSAGGGSKDAGLVLLERQGPVALLRLNRPEKHNAVTEQMSAEAVDLLDALEADDEVRATIVTGAGSRAFCAGQDMAEASGRVERPAVIRGGGASGIARRLAACTKPVIGAINGFCYGGGLSIALSCDFRLAADSAMFRMPGTTYGLVVSATLLTSVVGPGAAKDILFTARAFDAAEARDLGLVSRVVPGSELETLAWEYAHMVATNSPIAVRHAKRVVNLQALQPMAMEAEQEVNRLLRGGDDNVARFNDAASRVLKER